MEGLTDQSVHQIAALLAITDEPHSQVPVMCCRSWLHDALGPTLRAGLTPTVFEVSKPF